jgi:hypothetical protein
VIKVTKAKFNPARRWYPTKEQLKDPDSVERAFRQMLTQHYALKDQADATDAAIPKSTTSSTGPPPGCGPTDSQICGLYVTPVDVKTMTDGVKLTYVKATGQFTFK